MSLPFAVRLLLSATIGALIAAGCSTDTADPAPATDPAEFASESLDAAAETPRVHDDSTPTTEVHDIAPVLTDVPGEPINKFTLETGDCFDLVEALQDGRPATITTRLPCEDPHDFEVFATLLYPAEHPSIYPGEDVVRNYALQSCYRRFEPWVGREYELSALEIDVIIPPRENFEDDVARYRGIHCLVERADGDPMVGSSARSGW